MIESVNLVPNAKDCYPFSVIADASYRDTIADIKNHIELADMESYSVDDVQIYDNNHNRAITGSFKIADCVLGWGPDETPTACSFVAFRGSSNIENWADDLMSIVPVPFVREENTIQLAVGDSFVDLAAGLGFIDAYNGLRQLDEPKKDVVNAALNMAKLTKGRLVIIGHSLGGSIATLMMVEMYNDERWVQKALVTFGCPRTLGAASADAVFQLPNITHGRFVNMGDPVPSFPEVGMKHICPPWAYHNGKWSLKHQDFGGLFLMKIGVIMYISIG